ncbi:MAG: transcriptional regulator GcvA [Litoreibacter sp.]|nr:transcriptional regulator GcvA [Litoreibacter sp.]
MDRLPPLTALRAFEAAARHMSFAQAADELHVTPAALSFQIKSLEQHLGAPVFRRLNRAVELTEEGKLLQPGVQDGFEALQGAWRNVQRRLNQDTLTVTAGPGFTAKWLAPRLFSFAQANPDIELRFSASLQLADFERDDVDVAIRFGQGADKGLYSKRIINEWMAPMVSPVLAEELTTLEDLTRTPLLHDDHTVFLNPHPSWKLFFESCGLPEPGQQGPHFSQSDHAIDAALASAGVVLGRISMTESHLREGRLVMPFKKAMRLNAAYRLVCPSGSEERPLICRFIKWVEAETADLEVFEQGLEFIEPASGQ